MGKMTLTGILYVGLSCAILDFGSALNEDVNPPTSLDMDSAPRSDIESHPSWTLLPSDCGQTRFDKHNKRIILGEEAKLGEFPWMAQLGYGYKRYPLIPPIFVCGGAILNRYYILSAAHCGRDLNVVRVGENHIETSVDCEDDVCAPPHQDIYIESSIFYSYNERTHKGDIALFRLETPISFNDFVQPICLPKGVVLRRDIVGKNMRIAGWGITNSTTMDEATKLMYILAPVVDQDECNMIYPNKLDSSQHCVGYKAGKDSCTGDSGGPITRSERLNGERRNIVFGLVSYGKANCGTGVAVYTNVQYYVPWILNQLMINYR